MAAGALAVLLASAGAVCTSVAGSMGGAQARDAAAGADATADEEGVSAVGSGSSHSAAGASLMAAQQTAAAESAAAGNGPASATAVAQTAAGATPGGASPNGASDANASSQLAAEGANGAAMSRATQSTWAGLLAGMGGDSGAASGVSQNVTADAGKASGGTASVASLPGAPTLSPLLAQNLSSAGAAAASMTRGLSVPVSDPGWPHALAAQVQWMVGAQMQSATLRLSPPHLGSLEVRIDLQSSQQINVTFSASHPDTRAALADAVPRLRELFAAGGLNLGQATVQQDAGSDASGHASRAPSRRTGALSAAETVEPVALSTTGGLGLVDEYV